jgi:hypothetical protein
MLTPSDSQGRVIPQAQWSPGQAVDWIEQVKKCQSDNLDLGKPVDFSALDRAEALLVEHPEYPGQEASLVQIRSHRARAKDRARVPAKG